MLPDLESIKKVFVEKYNKNAKANKAKVAKVSKAVEICVSRKCANGGTSDWVSKKGCSVKYCRWSKAYGGIHTTHDTVKCCKYEKDGSLMDKSAKPYDSSKKPWQNKPSGGGYQMAYLTKMVGKLERKHKMAKSKKLAKKSACD